MKYALAALALLSACAPETTKPIVYEKPSEVAYSCTRSAADRMGMGEPAYVVYKECVVACKRTTNESLCADKAKEYIELTESVLTFKSNMNGL